MSVAGAADAAAGVAVTHVAAAGCLYFCFCLPHFSPLASCNVFLLLSFFSLTKTFAVAAFVGAAGVGSAASVGSFSFFVC